MTYYSNDRRVTVMDRYIGSRGADCSQSETYPGKWFCVFFPSQFFRLHTVYAVIDDFGSLVEVAQ